MENEPALCLVCGAPGIGKPDHYTSCPNYTRAEPNVASHETPSMIDKDSCQPSVIDKGAEAGGGDVNMGEPPATIDSERNGTVMQTVKPIAAEAHLCLRRHELLKEAVKLCAAMKRLVLSEGDAERIEDFLDRAAKIGVKP